MTPIPADTSPREPIDPQRRRLLAGTVGLSLLLCAGSAAFAQEPAACPGIGSNAGMRRALNFKPVSPDPKKRCELCSFFKPGAAKGCGTCQLLSGGGVAAASLCDNFAPKG